MFYFDAGLNKPIDLLLAVGWFMLKGVALAIVFLIFALLIPTRNISRHRRRLYETSKKECRQYIANCILAAKVRRAGKDQFWLPGAWEQEFEL
jgi:hypothetical protein